LLFSWPNNISGYTPAATAAAAATARKQRRLVYDVVWTGAEAREDGGKGTLRRARLDGDGVRFRLSTDDHNVQMTTDVGRPEINRRRPSLAVCATALDRAVVVVVAT